MTLRIAMWSGPRNISTALMRAWENRPDTVVVDEPFYAYYLKKTSIVHPGVEEIIASQANDWQQVVQQVSQAPISQSVCYQKQMTHHILDEVDLTWTQPLKHCFLIRDPLYVVNSYVKKRPTVTLEDIGIKQQFELYQKISNITQQTIPILDAKEFLCHPQIILEQLCEFLEIPFYPQMLHWPAGKRASDGIWAKYWYHAVEMSTGFAPFEEPLIEVTEAQRLIAEESRSYYEALYKHSSKMTH